MKKIKKEITKNIDQLADLLGLTESDAIEIEIRTILNQKIIDTVIKKGLTHADVAVLAHTSRTRITAIMNHSTKSISTDLLLRVLCALGVRPQISFKKAA